MRKLAVLSMHTSPLAQPGSGDGGGMNVYVRELSSSLARAGVECDVYTRAWSGDLPALVEVEPGLTVHHVGAGPRRPVPKGQLHELVGEFTEAVADRMAGFELLGAPRTDAIHANYWLSGMAGHALKHRLGIPLVSTFHTLDRVKAEASPEEFDEAGPVQDEPFLAVRLRQAIFDDADDHFIGDQFPGIHVFFGLAAHFPSLLSPPPGGCRRWKCRGI